MASDKHMRAFRKGSLRLAKSWAERPDFVLPDGITAEDLLRKVRNRIWAKYGQEELDELEAEIDLGL